MSPEATVFENHINQHGCGTFDTTSPTYMGGFINCPVALPLWLDLDKDERDEMLDRWGGALLRL
jgi:hypothetical protein